MAFAIPITWRYFIFTPMSKFQCETIDLSGRTKTSSSS